MVNHLQMYLTKQTKTCILINVPPTSHRSRLCTAYNHKYKNTYNTHQNNEGVHNIVLNERSLNGRRTDLGRGPRGRLLTCWRAPGRIGAQESWPPWSESHARFRSLPSAPPAFQWSEENITNKYISLDIQPVLLDRNFLSTVTKRHWRLG